MVSELIKKDLHYARSEVLQNWGEKKDGENFIGMKIDFGVDKLILIFIKKLVSSYILIK